MYYLKENPHGGDTYGETIALDFSASCNPLGAPPGAVAAAREALAYADRYPDPYCRALVRAIAEREGVPERYVLCGGGASELIYAYRAAAGAERAAELAPTFSEYAASIRYPLRRENDFLPDEAFLDFLDAERPGTVYLCNPNNPTGRLIPPALLEEIFDLCRTKRIRLFADECFLELSGGGSMKKHLAEYPGLFILNAFTKTYGMAGLRLGWCLSADAALLSKMSEAMPPWNVSGPAQAAGVAALREGAYLREARALIETERRYLQGSLEALGLRPCPSEANFLLFRGPAGLRAALAARGVAIRDCANFPNLGPGWYRAAVRKHEENEILISALRAVCSSPPEAGKNTPKEVL